ncbi:MAG: 2-phosphosulfolactate phosphatase family protein [Acaryochloridaceae cyanobacterium CSU_3_4]|nr:2-phosphosulfolactate phosphatase family protein [Acaryochloridaceae cyanobacterium CSU_3_4]
MKLFVYHTPEEIPSNRLPSCAIVIDVLRASSTIATAIHAGAEAVQVFNDLELLVSSSDAVAEEKRLRAGERGGRQVKGFEFGNSPLAFTPENTQGRRLFLSTTNGTRCSESVRNASKVIIAALINRRAVVNYLCSKKPGTVWLVGSGWEGSYSLEDTVCAGAIIEGVLAAGKTPLAKLAGNDEAIAAVSLYRQWQGQLGELLDCGSHGQRLLKMRAQADVAYCAQLDVLDVLPIQRGLGTFVQLQPGLIEKTCEFLARLVGRKPEQKGGDDGVPAELIGMAAQEELKPQVESQDGLKAKKVKSKVKPQIQSAPQTQQADRPLTQTEQKVELKAIADKVPAPVLEETPKTDPSEAAVSASGMTGAEQVSEEIGEETPTVSPMETAVQPVAMEPTETKASQLEKAKGSMVGEVQGIWSKMTKVNPNYQRVPSQKDK